MENKIKLLETLKNRNKVIFHYEISGEFKKYLKTDQEFYIEYSFSVQQVPTSVLNVAFVCNILPLVWILDGELIIDELDADFIGCIEQIKEGYEVIYPHIDFKGYLTIKNSIKIQSHADPSKSLLIFFDEVDATSAMIKVMQEKPLLMSLWGTDIFLDDVEGWNTLYNHIDATAKEFGLPHITVKSSFRNIFFYDQINQDIAKPHKENWWHEFQHGIALLSHTAPIAFYYNLSKVYLPATYSPDESRKDSVCAFSPIIDNHVRFCECRCILEGFEDSRGNKVKAICDYSKKYQKSISLYVCRTYNAATNNCCKCEKCIRTILEILGAGYDPADFGFNIDDGVYKEIISLIDEKNICISESALEWCMNKLFYNKELQENNVLVKYMIEQYRDRFGEKYRQQFFPTVFTIEKNIIDDYSNNEIIGNRPLIFRDKPNNSTFESAIKSVGENTGNIVFLESIKKNLDAYEIPYCEYLLHQDEFKNNPVITTDLIWITESGNFDYLIDQLENMKYQSMIPLGVGIQARLTDCDIKLNSSAKRALEMMQERHIIGVRGEFTADILQKNGIKNISIIGCPSMYYWGNPNFNVSIDIKQPKKIAANFRTIYGILKNHEKNFLSYCANRNYAFVEQTALMLEPGNVNDPGYYNYISNWLNNNSNIFFDIERWSKFIRHFDFSIGYRFHGNVIALWNDIKALFLVTDMRTKEMLSYFKLPFIYADQFDDAKSIDYYYELANYDEFNKSYHEKYIKFLSFIKENGLKIWGT